MNEYALIPDPSKPPVVFVLSREEYERLRPCEPARKRDWWADSPRLERTLYGDELLVYREGWEAEMARTEPGALIWLGQKGLGGLDEKSARELVRLTRESVKGLKGAPVVEPETTVVEGAETHDGRP